MCFKVVCKTCGKYTWQGCGKHVEQVLADVKPEDLCKCQRKCSSPKKIILHTHLQPTTLLWAHNRSQRLEGPAVNDLNCLRGKTGKSKQSEMEISRVREAIS